MVEYISPNNNKPLHIGHIRNGLLGESICGLLASQGHQIIRALLLNDRGLPIAKSMVTYRRWGEGSTPESSGLKGTISSPSGTSGTARRKRRARRLGRGSSRDHPPVGSQ